MNIKGISRDKLIGFFAVFFIVLFIYLYTLAPTVSFWDCGEFLATSYTLGIPHPPGTPLQVLIGRMFSLIPFSKEIARRINLFSPLAGATAASLLYLLMIKIISRWRKDEKITLLMQIAAGAGAIIAAVSFSVWDNAVEAEVYSPSVLVMTFLMWVILVWDDNREQRGDKNLLLFIAYLTFLSMGIHLMPLLVFPGIIIFILITNWKEFKDPKLLSIGIMLILIAVTTYAYLMIRSRLHPDVNEADPQTFKALWAVFTRKQYGPMHIFPRKTATETGFSVILAFWQQLKVYFKYFSWQYMPYPRESGITPFVSVLSVFITYIYTILGIFGMYAHYKKDKRTFWLMFTTFLLTSLGLIIYLNLKFSPSDPNPKHQPHEVRERDYFFAPSFFFFAFFVGIAFYEIGERLKKKKIPYLASAPIALVFVLIPFFGNIHSHVNRRNNWIANDYGHNMLASCDDNSIMFTNGDNDTFPLWFVQEVKRYKIFNAKEKKGVVIANLSLLNTNWFIRQLKWMGVPLDFASPFEHTRLKTQWALAKQTGYKRGFEDFVIDNILPLRDREGKILYVKDIVIRDIIVKSLGKTPTLEDLTMPVDSFVEKYVSSDFHPSINIYFAVTVSRENRRGYTPHLKLEGMAYKLIQKKGSEMVDVKKTEDLLLHKYSYRSIFDPAVYKDETVRRLLSNYGAVFFALGRSLRSEVVTDQQIINASGSIPLTPEKVKILERAIAVYEKGVKFMDDPIIFLMELRGIYTLLGRENAFLPVLKQWADKKPSGAIYSMLGKIYKDEGKVDDAVSLYKKAMKFDSSAVEPVAGLLEIYIKSKNDRLNADILAENLIKNVRVYGRLVGYYVFVKDTAMVRYLLSKWVKRNPNDAQARQILKKYEGK